MNNRFIQFCSGFAIVFLMLGAFHVAHADYLSNLVLHYTLDDDAANTTVTDSVGTSNGTASSNTSSWSAPGKIGLSFLMPGDPSYVDTNYTWSASDGSFTLAFWFKTTTTGTLDAVANYDGQSALIAAAVNSGALLCQARDSADDLVSVASNASTYNDGNWHFAACVLDATNMHLYIDGSLDISSSNGSMNGNFRGGAPRTMVIGQAGNSTGYFVGNLDDICIYNRALSGTDVSSLYASTVGCVAPPPSHKWIIKLPPNALTLGNGLIGWWTFDGKNLLKNVVDSSGQGNTGYLAGITSTSTATTIGRFGQALSFNGSSGRVSVGNQASLDFNASQSFSISAWIDTPDPNSTQTIVSKEFDLPTADAGYELLRDSGNNGTPAFGVKDGTNGVLVASSITNISNAKWHNLLAVLDRTAQTAYLYVDGALAGSQDVSTVGSLSNAQSFDIGSTDFPGNLFDGKIDDVRVYDRALSAAEAKSLYAFGTVAIKAAALNGGGGGGGSATAFIVSGHGTSRNDFTGAIGCKFTASANMTVTDLGRLVLSGNTLSHTVFLTSASGIVLASQTIPTSGVTADTYNFVSITPVALTAGTSYYIVSHEDSGGDSWYDEAPVTVSTGTVDNSAHAGSDPPVIFTDDAAGECFGNPNFEYTIP